MGLGYATLGSRQRGFLSLWFLSGVPGTLRAHLGKASWVLLRERQ